MRGWQFHSSNASESREFRSVQVALARPSRRRNATARGKAPTNSCRGRFAPNWLITCPTSDHLLLTDQDFQASMRFRLGLAFHFAGPDPHGYRRLADNREARLHARHFGMLSAWRQAFLEAGGQVPDRNMERMLSNTHVPVPEGDQRRMDIVVAGLSVYRGLPLFCDATVLSSLIRSGCPRNGTSNVGGRLLEAAEEQKMETYPEVEASGLGKMLCLGCEVFGRWSNQVVDLSPRLAVARAHGLRVRVRWGVALGLLHRWSGLLSIALQRAVARAIIRDVGADLVGSLVHGTLEIGDLPCEV